VVNVFKSSDIRNKMKTLLIDDVRTIEAVDIIARNYFSGIEMLKSYVWEELLLDHDLASYDETGKEYTGYDVMCWIEQNLPIEKIPKTIRCVSANPVGRAKIEQVIEAINKRRSTQI
jgi:hypothetical protein